MELTGIEGGVLLLAMARARMISSQTLQKLSSLLYPLHSTALLIEVGLLFANFIRPRRASPHGAALLMWRMAPDPPREPPSAAADLTAHVIVERVHCAQRESCHYGRLIDRVKANENTWNPI